MPFNPNRKPAKPSEWRDLLDAVFTGEISGETDWIEWKSSLDLGKSSSLEKISKTIVGFANRPPSTANSPLGGVALMVIGLENGSAAGVDLIDNAVLEDKIDIYLGKSAGPSWEPRWVRYEDVHVLIIEVAPTSQGDPIFSLQQGGQNTSAGQVFVRRGSRTVPAMPEDFRALAVRASSKPRVESLDVSLRVQTSTPFETYSIDPEQIEQYISRVTSRMLREAEEAELPKTKTPFNSISVAAVEAMFTPESRTIQEFQEELNDYGDEIRRVFQEAAFQCVGSVLTPPTFVIDNLGSSVYKDVQITIRVEGTATAVDVENEQSHFMSFLPKPPRKFGATQNKYSIGISPFPHSFDVPVHNFGRRNIQNGGSFTLSLDEIEIRPKASGVLVEDGTVFLIPASRKGPLEVAWEATASNVDAHVSGIITLDFTGETYELTQLLENE